MNKRRTRRSQPLYWRFSRSPSRGQRSVRVSAYRRFRFGRWETVRAHFRSPPGTWTQLPLDF